jgi:hypothetical protein
MPSPDAPDCFAVRRLNPFLGVAEVMDIGFARAVSIDGITWQVQIHARPPAGKWGSQEHDPAGRRYVRFGHWTETDGLVRTPVNPELDINELIRKSGMLLEVLGACAGNIPYNLEDTVELWLMDGNRMPLALLASVVREDLTRNVKVDKWWAAMPAEAGFHSPVLEKKGYPNTASGSGRGHASCIEKQVMDLASGHQWFTRSADGSGRMLVNEGAHSGAQRAFRRECFPDFTVRDCWENEDIAAVVSDWIQWSAPRLLTLQDLDDTTRGSLEHAARPNAMLVDETFRLYPRVINEDLIERARVEARIRRCTET